MEITQQYFCPQQHVLLVNDSEIGNANQITCQICESSVVAPFYVCDTCKYYVHKSCKIKKINHPFHPRHPLSLTPKNALCDSCGQYSRKSFMFSCIECRLSFDVDCALMSNSCPQGQKHCIQHSTHPHLLLLVDTTDTIYKNIHVRCFACQSKDSPSDDQVYYGCNRCKYFLHKQCIDQLPQQIQTFAHPNHGCLSLRMIKFYLGKCFLCKSKDPRAFYYECQPCNFRLCMDCNVIGVLKYKYHDHPLFFVKKMSPAFDQCNIYNTCFQSSFMAINVSNEFQKTESFRFHCCDCDFKLHLLCGPLPRIIKYEGHVHSLLLVDSFIEDSSGEYNCDICETERNPRIRIYCCGDCKYFAHVHCVISEIIDVLKGDLEDVELKALGYDFCEETNYGGWGEIEHGTSLLSLKDLILQLSEYELFVLKAYFTWDEKKEESEMTTQLETEDEKIDEILTFSSFTETEFMSYIFNEFGKIYKKRSMKIKPSDLALKIADIEGYFIPLELVPVFKNLLHKYGDIGSRCGYSKAFKSMCYFLICKAMKEMHTTWVIDITKDLLQYWYHHIKFVQLHTYFELGFLKASLEEITRDFFYLQLSLTLETDIRTIMNKRIAHIKKKMAEYEEFCESTSKKKFMKEGFNKVVQLKWKTAGQVGNDIDGTSSHYDYWGYTLREWF
ncbi:uncharacterized protein LOC115725216 isoform X1 [Cannabis sativa]|uniref:uncharacterized protein LOC115725216 isoform X1 n=1 Tax=Cannabis sativa TaxID=3483 RepID=UPI0029CA88DF|nr:uncharacterized protein LOC115725216 isoform X1 [Cannabis sativa]